jgi:riboflavin kinase / FMN adenylyltransferase
MARVYRSLDAIGPDARNATVCIGNFDGVHEGHRALLRRNLEISHQMRTIPSVLTFDPHPTKVVAPHRAPRLLTTIAQRAELLSREGIEQVFVLPFDRGFSELRPDEFVRTVLVDAIGARAVLVGDNFRFGHGQAGDVETLRALGEQFGFRTEIVTGVRLRGRFVSSTAAREAIESGAVSIAARLLGRPYSVDGVVVSGFGIGSKQTVPTINLQTDAEVLPAHGVYITRTHDLDAPGRQWPSITNVGFRPTFDGDRLTVETYLLASLEGNTPERIRLEFLRRVREERKFDSPEALKAQILRDVGRAQTYFRRTAGLRSGSAC